MKRLNRFDNYRLDKVEITDSGFLKAPVTVTRSGIFIYRQADGSEFKEFRPPEEVFKADSMGTIQGLPATNKHPTTPVTPTNAKGLTVGFTSQRVEQNDDHVETDLTVFDGPTIADMQRDDGREVSLGYSCEVEFTPGVHDGQRYDAVQRNIVYNHLALNVGRARAGSKARVHLDGEDAELVVEVTRQGDDPIIMSKGDNAMSKFKVDGVEHEADAGVASHVTEAIKRRDSEIESLKTQTEADKGLKTQNDELQAKVDGLEADKTKLQSKVDEGMSPEKIREAAKARTTLVTDAAKRVDAETVKKLDEMSDKDIKIAVIKNDVKDFDAEGKSDDYINARYDHAVQTVPAKSDDDLKDHLGKNRQDGGDKTPELGSTERTDHSRSKAREDSLAEWQKPLSASVRQSA